LVYLVEIGRGADCPHVHAGPALSSAEHHVYNNNATDSTQLITELVIKALHCCVTRSKIKPENITLVNLVCALTKCSNNICSASPIHPQCCDPHTRTCDTDNRSISKRRHVTVYTDRAAYRI
ncbi:hypothetical protein J6590_103809, partial [Homalodisca vitripennis]